MAKLSAHGRVELARRETPTARIALMSDGNILRNSGSGWKEYKRLKPGVDPYAYARKFAAATAAMPQEISEYVEALRNAVPLSLRAKLHTLITLMPEDPDGVWAEINEWQNVTDFPEVQAACMRYRIAQEWAKTQERKHNEDQPSL